MAALKNKPTSSAVKRKRLNPKIRKKHILDVAITMAYKVGYLNIKQIPLAKAAQVNQRLIAYYFGGMTQLKKAVLKESIERKELAIIAQGILMKDKITLKLPNELKTLALQLVGFD